MTTKGKQILLLLCALFCSIQLSAQDNRAVISGIVTDVANLSETGTTVTVSIGNGYETTTGLIENVNLKKGDKVVAGQLIGTVASPSAYYIEEGPGVYFKLTQYGEPINPDTYFVE